MQFLKIVKYSAKPPNIIFPLPLIPLAIGLFAGNVSDVIYPIVLTYIFYPAVNLWNHINDAEDDFAVGKDNPFINKGERVVGYSIVTFLYLLSFIYVIGFSKSYGVFLFSISALMTFLYSDNKITKLRLKRHYATELLVYTLTVPSYLLALFDLIKPVDNYALMLTLTLSLLLLSTVVIKDFKDISEDKKAGLKTLALVFSPSTLLKISFLLVTGYFIMITLLSFLISQKYLISVIPLFGIIYSAREFFRERWEVSLRIAKPLNFTIISGIISLFLFCISAQL